VETKSSVVPASSSYGKTCHTDPCNPVTAYPNLWLGSEKAINYTATQYDYIVCLSSSSGSIWSKFLGKFIYVPINDYKALPLAVLKQYAGEVVALVREGKQVAIHCMGGHGRTGYFATAVLFYLGEEHYMDKTITRSWIEDTWEKLDVPVQVVPATGTPYMKHGDWVPVPRTETFETKDPLGFLRAAYCKKAVESDEQIESLQELTGLKFIGHKASKPPTVYAYSAYGGTWGNAGGGYGTSYGSSSWGSRQEEEDYEAASTTPMGTEQCWECEHYDVMTTPVLCIKGYTKLGPSKPPTKTGKKGKLVCSAYVKYSITK
jgi:hypothetical protein